MGHTCHTCTVLLSKPAKEKMQSIFSEKPIKLVLITSIWINASEVFRYFVIVMPAVRKNLPTVANVAPMDWWVFSIWGVWDTILTISIVFISWLCSVIYGNTLRAIFIAGTTCWATLFVLFWLAMVNMNLSGLNLLAITLPLSWFEMLVDALIVIKLLQKNDDRKRVSI